jgi:hypothetical protein
MKSLLITLLLLFSMVVVAQTKAVPNSQGAATPEMTLNDRLCDCFRRKDSTGFQNLEAFANTYRSCLTTDPKVTDA